MKNIGEEKTDIRFSFITWKSDQFDKFKFEINIFIERMVEIKVQTINDKSYVLQADGILTIEQLKIKLGELTMIQPTGTK